MRKNKFIYTLSALMMACIISFSGVGGSYIQAEASSGVFDVLWNTDVDAWTNIKKHIELWCCTIGVYPNFGLALLNAEDFKEFMLSDGYSEEEAEECVHGGGGHIRDGISVDDDGNVTYSDEVSDLFHDYICNYLETECGYWVVETMAAEEFINSYYLHNSYNSFTADTFKTNFIQSVKNLGGLVGVSFRNVINITTDEERYSNYLIFYKIDKPDFVLTDSSSVFSSESLLGYINNSGIYSKFDILAWRDLSSHDFFATVGSSPLTSDNLNYYESNYGTLPVFKQTVNKGSSSGNVNRSALISSDGRLVKIWKSVDYFNNFNIKQQPFYYTQNWVNYDASQDNSITMTSAEYQYYSDNSTTIFQTIQNNIDNSGSDLTEEDIQKIVDDAVKEIKDSILDNSGSGDSGSDDSGSDDDGGGTGVGDLIDGIGKIFDTILSLIGKLMGVVADFTQSILDLFSGFTTFTDGFSDFLAGAFSFIPAEVWDIIKVGLSLMVLLAVIKFLRK